MSCQGNTRINRIGLRGVSFGERDVSFQMFCIFVLYQDNFIVSRKVPTDIEMACIEIETICSVRNQK